MCNKCPKCGSDVDERLINGFLCQSWHDPEGKFIQSNTCKSASVLYRRAASDRDAQWMEVLCKIDLSMGSKMFESDMEILEDIRVNGIDAHLDKTD